LADEKRGGGSGFIAWVLVVGLFGAVMYLASERNARKWFLAVDNGQLTVQRGRMFVTGTRTLGAGDGEFGKAYAPISLPKDAKVQEGEYDDRAQLDRALFEQLLPVAKAAADKPDAASQADAMQLADRASELPGLSAQQLEQLQALRGDLAFAAAEAQLKSAASQVEAARRLLLQARERGGRHALQAGALGDELKPLVDKLAGRATEQPPASAPAPVQQAKPSAPAQPPAVTPPATPALAAPAARDGGSR
jgi:hypothetical protein